MASVPPQVSDSTAPLAELRDVALAREPDRYLAATLAPVALRYDLVVLAAFAAEIARIASLVREPLAGEIRLPWWRDALIGESADTAAGHPVAMAMRATIARFALPAATVEGVIDAQADMLHGERPADEVALRVRMAASEGGLFRLAARICAGTEADDGMNDDARTADLAGFAYGVSRALVSSRVGGDERLLIPHSLVADANLAERARVASALGTLSAMARAAHADVAARVRQMSRRRRLAFLPLAMVKPNLRALEREADKQWARPGDTLPIGRLLRIAWAHASGRV
jgi:phytoene synthase